VTQEDRGSGADGPLRISVSTFLPIHSLIAKLESSCWWRRFRFLVFWRKTLVLGSGDAVVSVGSPLLVLCFLDRKVLFSLPVCLHVGVTSCPEISAEAVSCGAEMLPLYFLVATPCSALPAPTGTDPHLPSWPRGVPARRWRYIAEVDRRYRSNFKNAAPPTPQ
jgi:hypothetical protein